MSGCDKQPLLYGVWRITWEVVGSTLRFFFWFCLFVRGYTTSCSLHLETDEGVFVTFVCTSCPAQTYQQTRQDHLPIDDLFILSSDEILLVRGNDAQGVLLACLGLGVYDVRT